MNNFFTHCSNYKVQSLEILDKTICFRKCVAWSHGMVWCHLHTHHATTQPTLEIARIQNEARRSVTGALQKNPKLAAHPDGQICVERVDYLGIFTDFADEALLAAEGTLLYVSWSKLDNLLQLGTQATVLDLKKILQSWKYWHRDKVNLV